MFDQCSRSRRREWAGELFARLLPGWDFPTFNSRRGKSRFPNDGTFRPNLATSLAGLLTRCFPNKLLDGISMQSKKKFEKIWPEMSKVFWKLIKISHCLANTINTHLCSQTYQTQSCQKPEPPLKRFQTGQAAKLGIDPLTCKVGTHTHTHLFRCASISRNYSGN